MNALSAVSAHFNDSSFSAADISPAENIRSANYRRQILASEKGATMLDVSEADKKAYFLKDGKLYSFPL